MRISKRCHPLIYSLLIFGLLGVSSLEAGCRNHRHFFARKILAMVGIQTDFDLQQRIINAREGEIIDVPAGTFSGPFVINKSLTLRGTLGENGEILSRLTGNGAHRVLVIAGEHGEIPTITLENLIIRDGKTDQSDTEGGAGILNRSANLKLSNVRVLNNQAPDKFGGGILNQDGNLEVINSEVRNNTAFGGGGISSTSETSPHRCKIKNSVISFNSCDGGGGGIRIGAEGDQNRFVIKNSQIYNNEARGGGGISIFVNGDSIVIVSNSILENNSATGLAGGGGGIAYIGRRSSVTLNNSVIRNNEAVRGDAGGILNSGNRMTLNGSRVQNNHANKNGGGIFNDEGSQLILQLCRVIGNVANNNGGGIFNDGKANLIESIITNNQAGNDGGGVFTTGTGRTRFNDTLVINNQPPP